ncbi:phenoloxidase-activating factor 3-like [Eriocheir sinensis]|uniref:phenoloxidase-activating factor 3-like n=1 Tax=Eriocheir sinensis TaxID=95602 RepID=UPI0021C56DB5|nr:phenoloxidase-activating factor 3-like [Eriocheir sinensis]
MGRLNVAATLMVVLVVATCSRAQEGSGCTDASGLAGRCISIRNCPPLRQLLQSLSGNTPNPNALEILRRSVCSFANNLPLVCCGRTSPNSTSTNPVATSSGRDLLPSRCGVTGLTDKIIDGEDADLLAWPWMAVLRGKFPGQSRSQWYCGGVLINDRYVLTAAHCFKTGISPRLEFVRLGEHTFNSNPDCQQNLCAPSPQDIPVEQIIPHPQYESPCRECNDIALLRLARPATLDFLHVVPICLPVDPLKDMGFSEEEFQGKFAFAAGWGSQSRDPNRPDPADTLQQALLPIGEGEFCLSRLKRGYPDNRMTLCAGGQGKDTCKGDSGGPLMLANKFETRRFVVGITSLGPTVCGTRGTQALYTNVHYYAQWIIDTLRP